MTSKSGTERGDVSNSVTYRGNSAFLNTCTGNPGCPVTTPDFSTHTPNPFQLSDNLLPAHSSRLGQIGAMAMASMAKSIMEGAAPMLHTLLLANMQVKKK